MKKKIVILTGAGISAESGLATFRDAGGLWEGYRIEDVATPQAWRKDPALVLDFYNQRRKAALVAEPNAAHFACVELEKNYDVTIVTQNVDNLHEKAGSKHVVHLHGELFKSRSTYDPKLVYDISGWELSLGDKCEKGSQLRPHIVWFGEAVPKLEEAAAYVRQADILVVVGTSLQVYPAAGLVDEVSSAAEIYVIDPHIPTLRSRPKLHTIAAKATNGMAQLLQELVS
ncbi:NAD-dependent deacetylase [Flexibacter flexilis DSM 6793]|uniref:NAD-dependent protein deacylase n=1 Tax=Flexibacter flexilis DSM 6793 TaxID=927664 RepID=A0A1I1KRP0_9BACT|nr:NAD-dependent deacylase [Flexibacter flexilis]SFC63265.1 NAD-dependent deacetylase [Flexibacter flexilis DSM 6793]